MGRSSQSSSVIHSGIAPSSRYLFVPEDLHTAVQHHTGRKSCTDPGKKPACPEARYHFDLRQLGQEVPRRSLSELPLEQQRAWEGRVGAAEE